MPDRAATARERYLRYFITFTCHVHAIVEAEAPPERIMNEFKSYASRELNRLTTTGGSERKRWARHGSTRWLWKDEDVKRARFSMLSTNKGSPWPCSSRTRSERDETW